MLVCGKTLDYIICHTTYVIGVRKLVCIKILVWNFGLEHYMQILFRNKWKNWIHLILSKYASSPSLVTCKNRINKFHMGNKNTMKWNDNFFKDFPYMFVMNTTFPPLAIYGPLCNLWQIFFQMRPVLIMTDSVELLVTQSMQALRIIFSSSSCGSLYMYMDIFSPIKTRVTLFDFCLHIYLAPRGCDFILYWLLLFHNLRFIRLISISAHRLWGLMYIYKLIQVCYWLIWGLY